MAESRRGKGWGCCSVVEHWPSMVKVLCSVLSAKQNKTKQKNGGGGQIVTSETKKSSWNMEDLCSENLPGLSWTSRAGHKQALQRGRADLLSRNCWLLSATDHYLVLKVKVECAHTSENNINPLCRNPCGLRWAPGEFHFSLYLCLPSGLSGLSHTCSLQPGNQGLWCSKRRFIWG